MRTSATAPARPRRTREGWRRWYLSWERQQEFFNPHRERRFAAMLDVLEAEVGRRFAALDLGSGPGSLSVRILERFPRARSVALDFDPVGQRIGRGAFGELGGRLAWMRADLSSSGWDRQLPRRRYDAAVSTTALHWLDRPGLSRLYGTLARRLRRGGVFVNGDRLPWGPERPELSRLAEAVRAIRRRRAGLGRRPDGWAVWQAWWAKARRDPELGPIFALRDEGQVAHPERKDLPLAVHERALRSAGFRSVEVVWRDLEDAVLLARR